MPMSNEEWRARLQATLPKTKPLVVRPAWENADADPERFMNDWNPWQGLDSNRKSKRGQDSDE